MSLESVMLTKTVLSSLETKQPVKIAAPISENVPSFLCLQGADVITAKVSDHHPVIHGATLFWNMMMQGKQKGIVFNNGIGLIETDADYLTRLAKVARVVAEMSWRHPEIEMISFCEGPVQSVHIQLFFDFLSQYASLKKFITEQGFHQPNYRGDKFGLLMLADKQYQVIPKKLPSLLLKKLGNRFKIWKLTNDKHTKYLALAHLPYGRGDEYAIDIRQLTSDGLMYRRFMQRLLKFYHNRRLIVAGDFNLRY